MSGPTAHAFFGGSSAARLLACPGGYGLTVRQAEAGAVQARSSVYAAEGTVAHMLLEKVLTRHFTIPEIRRMARDGSEFPQDGHAILVTDDMADAIEQFQATVLPFQQHGWEWRVEARVSLAPLWAPSKAPIALFGTADFMAWSAKHQRLAVADFKYGRGVSVEVRDNAQLAFYAVGALLAVPAMLRLPGATVEVIVVQPRAPHVEGPVRRAEMLVLDLMMWADTLKAGVERVLDPNAPLVTGDHCRWCPALAVCPAMRAQAQTIAQRTHVVDPMALTPTQLGEALTWAKPVEAWFDAVRAHAELVIHTGKSVPGWKLVPKRPTRRWSNPGTVERLLGNTGRNPIDFMDFKLKSPAQLQKALPKHDWSIIDSFVDDTPGGAVLAPAADPRPSLRPSASEVFTIDVDD